MLFCNPLFCPPSSSKAAGLTTELERLLEEFDKAETTEELDELEKKVDSLGLDRKDHKTATFSARKCREVLVERAQKEGQYFEDARNLFVLRPAEPAAHRRKTEEKKLESLSESCDDVARKDPPHYYEHIVDAVKAEYDRKTTTLLASTDSLGSNSNFRLQKNQKDIFGKDVDPARAHLFLDSPSCGPAWGHMAELATGKMTTSDNDEKDRIRLVRMLGARNANVPCLRKDIHNYIILHNEHRVYFDAKPQLVIVPILGLEAIKKWNGTTPYDVLVFVASPLDESQDGKTCESLYRTILSGFPWERHKTVADGPEWKNDETNSTEGSDPEIRQAFTVLRHFIKALAESLKEEIPARLLESVNGNRTSKKGGNPGGSVKSQEDSKDDSSASSASGIAQDGSSKDQHGKKNKKNKKTQEETKDDPSTPSASAIARGGSSNDDQHKNKNKKKKNTQKESKDDSSTSSASAIAQRPPKYPGNKKHLPTSNGEDDLSEQNGPGQESNEEQKPKTKTEELGDAKKWLVEQLLSDGLPLPIFSQKNHRPVLKLRFGGQPVADPWLLIVKAAVNFSWLAYGHKFLPACQPPPLEDVEQEYQEALWEYEQREHEQRQLEIPATLTVTAASDVDTARLVTPTGEEGSEANWEMLSDTS